MKRLMMKSNRFSKLFSAFVLALLIVCVNGLVVFANEDEIDAIAITVIVPPLPDRPTPQTRQVFPINVAEGYNYEGIRELVRVYELLPNESPEWINTESFTRNGYYYQIADIVRRVDVAHTVREHTEVVEIPSATNDLAGVIAGLDPTLDFVDGDGYVGMLHLNIRSIEMTQDGTRSTSRKVNQTREFPHLSNPDLSLIPPTVTANGRTYTLADVDWRAGTSNAVDFSSVAQTYTAFATYTRTATSTVSTGYTTKAEYSGTLTRVSTGDVRFVATFIGTPIVSPVVHRPSTNTEPQGNGQEAVQPDAVGESQAETVVETAIVEAPENDNGNGDSSNNEVDYAVRNGDGDSNGNADNGSSSSNGGNSKPTISETETVHEAISEPDGSSQNSTFPLLILAAIPVGLIILVLILLMLRFMKKADALTRREYEETADTLQSRMKRIIKRDRKELANYAEYGDGYKPRGLRKGSRGLPDSEVSRASVKSYEGFDFDYKNFDEDGDEYD